MLADLLSKVERIRSGLITPAEAAVGDHADKPLAEHLEDYLEHLGAKRIRGRKVSDAYVRNTKGRLGRLLRECQLSRWQDVTRQIIERWLDKMENQRGWRRQRATSI